MPERGDVSQPRPLRGGQEGRRDHEADHSHKKVGEIMRLVIVTRR